MCKNSKFAWFILSDMCFWNFVCFIIVLELPVAIQPPTEEPLLTISSSAPPHVPEVSTDLEKLPTDVQKEVQPPTTEEGLSTGEVVGLVIGLTLLGILLTVLFIALAYFCCKRRRQNDLQASQISE